MQFNPSGAGRIKLTPDIGTLDHAGSTIDDGSVYINVSTAAISNSATTRRSSASWDGVYQDSGYYTARYPEGDSNNASGSFDTAAATSHGMLMSSRRSDAQSISMSPGMGDVATFSQVGDPLQCDSSAA